MGHISKSLAMFWPSIRISFALVLITISMILIADLLGIFPNPNQYDLENRKQFSESLAVVFSTMANEQELKNIRPVLSRIVLKRDDILSAGFRYESGQLLFSVGNHEQYWNNYKEEKSTSTHVQVPIVKGKKNLGTVELNFSPLNSEQGFNIFNSAIYKLVLFVTVSGFFAFLFFMLRTIRQIDPASVVPGRVNSAFDTLSEGVVILDDKEQIVLANSAFSEMVKRDQNKLLGFKLSEFSWQLAPGDVGEILYPWLIAMASGESGVGDILGLEIDSNTAKTLVINSAPIFDDKNEQQGILLTFDDVTELEVHRQQLQTMVSDLESSKKEVQRKNNELHFLATRDPLTNCFNRRSFNDLFAEEFLYAQQNNEQLSCLMVDLDHFKQVNDNYGHATGDAVIKMLAAILHAITRDQDIVGRYGGEEFCIVLPGLNVEAALSVAERIRLKIKDESTKTYQTEGPRVTASIGVSTINDNATDPASLTDQADQALYVAKDAGRNRVVRWSEEPYLETNTADDLVELENHADNRISISDHSQYTTEISRLQNQVEQLENAAANFSDQLQQEQNFDKLTGLPNQSLFYDQIIQAVNKSARQGLSTAILIIDVDLFSQVNNSFGRDIADEMFVLLTKRVIELFNKENSSFIMDSNDITIARFNNDELGILLTNLNGRMILSLAAKRILDAMSSPIVVDNKQVDVSCKIGISIYPEDADSPEELISHAGMARSFARKEQSLDNFQFYTPKIQEESLNQLRLASEIRTAIDHEQWHLYYQPKMNLSTGVIHSVEALIRWNHPERGIIGPIEFIQLAEERGLIIEIGEWVLRTACQQAKRWSDIGIDLSIAVNLSAIQIQQDGFADLVLDIVKETEIYPRQLELEVTETILMNNVDIASKVLSRLHSRGISISIDDFGTGYSSLSYLKQLPISALKIDRIFIKDLLTDNYDKNIVNSVISMAHGMELKVIAEGVETQEQLELLKEMSCDEMQGFLLSKPVDADNIASMLEQRKLSA